MPLANGDGVVFGLIGANVAVFLLWRIADPAFMRKHFMVLTLQEVLLLVAISIVNQPIFLLELAGLQA